MIDVDHIEREKSVEEIAKFLDLKAWAAGTPVPSYNAFCEYGFDGDWRKLRVDLYRLRHDFIHKFCFALLCAEVVQALVKLGPLVEVGAGSGIWAAILKANGADLIATDVLAKGSGTFYGFIVGTYTPIETLDGEAAVRKYANRAVLAVWPSLNEDWCTRAAAAIPVGGMLAFIGEGQGGCVAEDDLFELLNRDFTEIEDVSLPQWPGMHDRLTIYKRIGRKHGT